MKKVFLYILMIAIMSLAVSAFGSFTVNVVSSDSAIMMNETAYYVLNITNTQSFTSDFMLEFPNSDWISRTSPISDYTFSLKEKQSKLVKITLSPRSYLLTGPHSVSVNMKYGKNGKFSATDTFGLPIQLLRLEQKEYLPLVRYDVDMGYEVDPRKELKITLNLENLNYRNLDLVHISLESNLFSDFRNISIGPKESKTEVFNFNLNKTQEPLTDVLKIRVWSDFNNKSYDWIKKSEYKIISYNNLEKNPTVQRSFLKKTIYLDLKNNANIVKTYEVPFKINWFVDLFTKSEPKSSYTIHSSEGRFDAWSFSLKPMEETTIVITTSYRWLAIVIVLIILVIILYYVFRSPLVIKKEVSHIGTIEGGISDIKVILYIKNRTNAVIDDISIIEKVPHIADIGKEFQVGTIKPSKVIQNPKKGTLVKWELQNLEGHEERIITYKIKSKLSILGGLTLPATIIKFVKRGKSSKTKSNRLVLEI